VRVTPSPDTPVSAKRAIPRPIAETIATRGYSQPEARHGGPVTSAGARANSRLQPTSISNRPPSGRLKHNNAVGARHRMLNETSSSMPRATASSVFTTSSATALPKWSRFASASQSLKEPKPHCDATWPCLRSGRRARDHRTTERAPCAEGRGVGLGCGLDLSRFFFFRHGRARACYSTISNRPTWYDLPSVPHRHANPRRALRIRPSSALPMGNRSGFPQFGRMRREIAAPASEILYSR